MSGIREADSTARACRDTDPLLGPGRECFPAYVQQDEGESSLEFDQQTSSACEKCHSNHQTFSTDGYRVWTSGHETRKAPNN